MKDIIFDTLTYLIVLTALFFAVKNMFNISFTGKTKEKKIGCSGCSARCEYSSRVK